MRLYETIDGQWLGTQAEARSVAGKDWTTVDVPVDKQGLIGWLNSRTWERSVVPTPSHEQTY